jgi:hypothetical protein
LKWLLLRRGNRRPRAVVADELPDEAYRVTFNALFSGIATYAVTVKVHPHAFSASNGCSTILWQRRLGSEN